MAICDTFLKKLRTLKDYGILFQDASQIIVFKKISLNIYFMQKTPFSNNERKEKKDYNVFFLISASEGGKKADLFNERKLPVMMLNDNDWEMSTEDIQKTLDRFVKANFLAHELEKVSANIGGIIDPRLLDDDQ